MKISEKTSGVELLLYEVLFTKKKLFNNEQKVLLHSRIIIKSFLNLDHEKNTTEIFKAANPNINLR